MSDNQLERAAKVAQVIAEHPDLPIKVLAPSTPSDYDSYWYDATGARVAWLLYPDEVQGSDLRNYCGLNCERIYSDEDDACEDVSEWLFELWWDTAKEHGFTKSVYDGIPSDMLAEFCGADGNLGDFCDDVAWKIVENMPWHEYIVIDCY